LDEQKAVHLIEDLTKKLVRAQRQLSGLRQKAKYLEMQYDDAKVRESNSSELVMELVERQHELNVMLNRAQTMLSHAQEAMTLTSLEFNEIAKALPEPKKAEFSDRIAKNNELFKKTGIGEADLLSLDEPQNQEEEIPESEESRMEAAKASRWTFFWKRKRSSDSLEADDEAAADSPAPQTSEPAAFEVEA